MKDKTKILIRINSFMCYALNRGIDLTKIFLIGDFFIFNKLYNYYLNNEKDLENNIEIDMKSKNSFNVKIFIYSVDRKENVVLDLPNIF